MSNENVNPQPAVSRTAQIDAAISNIKAVLTAVKKDSENSYIGNRFASLNAHLQVVEPLVKTAGCTLSQPTVFDARSGQNVQITRITHTESGQSVESSLSLGQQPDMQKLGSAITYARRYTLSALLGMQAEDDDGNLASTSKTKKASKAVQGDF